MMARFRLLAVYSPTFKKMLGLLGPKPNVDYQCRIKWQDLMQCLSHSLSQEQQMWFSYYYTKEKLLSTEETAALML